MKIPVLLRILCYLISPFFILIVTARVKAQTNSSVKITFINTIASLPVVIDSVNYTNCWNETFTLHQLKYYISNICLKTTDKKMFREKNSYHLVNEEDNASKSISFIIPSDNYTSLSFMIGVDSLKNVSGAQTDALDPLNGMFWTWNTGYIMFKLEGNSLQSNSIDHRIEYHIGGFAGTNNTTRKVELNLTGIGPSFNNHGNKEIIIQTNIDKIWNAKHAIKISNTPVCTSPGVLASAIADNYSKAFEIIKIIP